MNATARDAWRVGDVVDDLYEVRQVITSGGMGLVHRVWHRGWNLELAVKTPRPQLVSSPQQMINFETEAETWVGLGLHPHVVACVYVRRLDGLPRVFAEWGEGGSLAEVIESARLYEGSHQEALARILDVAIQFAWGLDYAHSRGLVHQDVKPAKAGYELRQFRILPGAPALSQFRRYFRTSPQALGLSSGYLCIPRSCNLLFAERVNSAARARCCDYTGGNTVNSASQYSSPG